MPNFISDGATLSPTAPMHIGFSADGIEWNLVSKQNCSVHGIFSTTPGVPYPYTNKTILVIDANGNKMLCELQDIKGGDLVSYNTGTKASLDAAIKVVAHWIVSI